MQQGSLHRQATQLLQHADCRLLRCACLGPFDVKIIPDTSRQRSLCVCAVYLAGTGKAVGADEVG
jgi:hypothetical protein